jgi:myosin V
VKKYKKMLKVFIKRSKGAIPLNNIYNGTNDTINNKLLTTNLNSTSSVSISNNLNNISVIGDHLNSTMSTSNRNLYNSNNNNNNNITINGTSNSYVPQIINRQKSSADYLGMFEWKIEDEPKIIKSLIDDLKPRLAATFLPGLPAYILFMCIRYVDMLNDDSRVHNLLNSSIRSVKTLLKRKDNDLEYLVLWMTNFCRLIHNLKQYSGEVKFQKKNTPKQNEHCLKNYDLSDYRGILNDLAIYLFQGIIKEFEIKLSNIIVPAMLEHDTLQSSNRNNNNSIVSLNGTLTSNKKERITIETLTKKLTEFLNILNSHGTDPEIVNQIFRQVTLKLS